MIERDVKDVIAGATIMSVIWWRSRTQFLCFHFHRVR